MPSPVTEIEYIVKLFWPRNAVSMRSNTWQILQLYETGVRSQAISSSTELGTHSRCLH